jgi:hypothetical protein
MSVTKLVITSRMPYAGGASFGETGAYEDLRGVIHFAVDPKHSANRAIVDLDKAARDSDGRVYFRAGFRLFAPADPARANRRLLYYVVNRGKQVMPFNMPPPPAEPTDRVDPGDGFLMRHGWTVAWCGWQWDVIDDPALIGLNAPDALGPDGKPIPGQILIQFQPNEPHRWQHLSHYALHPKPGRSRFNQHRPYSAVDVNDPEAQLFVRDSAEGPRIEIPRNRWRFAREDDGRVVADENAIWLEDGFEPGRYYEAGYRTRICPVAGVGLLAVRDCTAFLRAAGAEQGNPIAGLIDRTYGYGISQCGRFLREFLYWGMNVDEAGVQVFDGLIPHVAGARRGEFNHRYAQPSAQHVPAFGHLPPFHDLSQPDPLAREVVPGLLERQRAAGGVPKIFHTNTSSEYWRIQASLVHSDLAGEHDADPAPEARAYMLAGTEHTVGTVPPPLEHSAGARTANMRNTVDYGPLMRAVLVNLDRWVTSGEEPPPNTVPSLEEGSAANREDVLAFFGSVPGAAPLAAEHLPQLRRLDLGPDASQGVATLPAKEGESHPSFVSAVDESGNEIAGIRLPDVAVPLASHTGWNPRAEGMGAPGENVDMLGATIPLPVTAADRARTGDPRRSIEERYRDRADYLGHARAAAEALVRKRFLLAEDVERVILQAGERYDFFTRRVRTAANSGTSDLASGVGGSDR